MPAPVIDGQRLEAVRLTEKFGDKVAIKDKLGELYVCVAPADLVAVCMYLKTDAEMEYTYFVECVGVDYSAWTHERDLPGRFEVVYNLFSTKYNSRLFVKTSVDDGASLPTLQPVWAGAEYPEREIQDLYGVIFEGNGPRTGERFLLPDDWIGYPLRKEYPLGGEDVVFHTGTTGPAIEDLQRPHAGESFEGKTGSEDFGGR
ncbi:MAG: NADH-quinone oxidoreductase subunit C [Armatimonadetes bacterium]|nr:NADH-quinone oxidoreductase subunit C [Armatimonadota bacterium]